MADSSRYRAVCLCLDGMGFIICFLEFDVSSPDRLYFPWVAVKAIGPPASTGSVVDAPWWDLPLRMTIATAMVLLITGGAERIGPQWSGILAPFPVFTCIMGIFAQKQSGPAALRGLLRGNMIGYFAAVSFYVIVGLTVERTSIIVSFLLATAVCLAVNGICLLLILRNKPGL